MLQSLEKGEESEMRRREGSVRFLALFFLEVRRKERDRLPMKEEKRGQGDTRKENRKGNKGGSN